MSGVGRCGVVKAVVADAQGKLPHGGGEILPAGGLVGVKKPQGEPQARKPVAGHSPVGDGVVHVGGPHVVDVLVIVLAPHGLHGAGELMLLVHHLPDGVQAAVLPVVHLDPVHHHAGHGPHAVVPLAPGLALDDPGQQLRSE